MISAGPDRQFQTACNAYPSAAALDKTPGTDDIVLGYTYGEASALAGGLWNLKSGDAETAEINRNLEVKDESGNVTFALDAQSGLGDFIGLTTGSIAGKSGPLDVTGGLKFESDSIALNAACTQEDAFAFDTATDMLVRCDGSIWVPSGGSDNLGNHEATENIQLKGFWLSNDGGDEGLQVADDGVVSTSGDMTVNNNLTTTGGVTVGSTLGVTGATTLTTLSTSGLATLNSASVTQNAGIGGTLDVTGGTTLTSLTTSGAAQINSATIDTTLGVTGATSLSTLSTSGLSTLDALAVTNNAAIGGTLDMTAGKISNLLDPTLAQDAASKAYVDARVASGTGFTEADPQVGTIQSTKWCVGNNDGTAIVCDQNMPVPADTLSGLSCSSGQIPKWNGTVWACAADNASGGGGGTGKGLVVVGSTTSLANGVTTNVAFSGTPTPNDFTGAWASNAFTVQTGDAGWYTIVGYVNLPNTSQHAIAYITVNGSNVAFSRDVSNTASNVIQYVNASAVTYLNEGDVVRLAASQAGGSTIALTNARLALAKMGGGGTGVADNLGDHIATQSVRLFKTTGSAGTVVAGTGDNLGDHTATQALAMGGFNITGAGAITGTSFTGNGSALTNLNASNLASGTVGTARLGTGTANNTTYLRGDGTWATVAAGAGDNLGDHIATQVLRSDTTNTDDLGTTAIRWKDGWFAGTVTATTGFAGPGTSLTALNASNLGSGTVPTARLGSGTANNTTYLRGDGTWAAVSGADDLGNHTATQTLALGTNWLNGDSGAEGLSVGTSGQVRIDYAGAGNTYDMWLQGGAGTSGTTRRLALLGTEAGMLYLNYASEYASGVTIGGPVSFTSTLTGNGSGLTTLNATNLASGTVPAARMPALTGDITMAAGTTATTIAANAVTTTEIAADTITAADIATGAVATAEILDGTIVAADLATDAVTTAKIAPLNVTNAEIANATIVATTKLSATGTKDSTTFLRGDNTWAVPPSGGISAVTTATCTTSCSGIACSNSCVVNCPAGYFRTGCGASLGNYAPSGAGCTCVASYNNSPNVCRAYCAQ